MKKLALPLALGLIVIVVDQASKQWALDALSGGRTISVFGDFLSFELAFNSGAAFSFGSSATWVFTLISAVVSVALPFFMGRFGLTGRIILGIVWGGAVGNLIDRLVREPGFPGGYVVDFINYNGWFIGNVADIALVVGLLALFLVEVFADDDATGGVEAKPAAVAGAEDGATEDTDTELDPVEVDEE
ncbi:signal peptidase II [Trueperella bonasi]|uniref:Lipoprotein signal peptidase n=1 Tax=Trueperella bonasi TaxID=312286 RepID=A0ABT9NI02_9ACTO|nr:signal peptidase II [Trueperella bonasi]MDP9807024.1 signal peptidase II [Trueperella bonasi]